MDKEKLSHEARVATSTFILAEWRHSAIVDVEYAFKNMMDAYQGNDASLNALTEIIEQFRVTFSARKPKLAEIAIEEKQKAARATDLLSHGEA